MAAAWNNERLQRLTFGQPDPQRAAGSLGLSPEWIEEETGPMQKARQLLSQFASGEPVSLASIKVCWDGRTEFQRTILSGCREILWGSTLSYGQLAARCGRPGAARAVGSAMRSNRHPLIIPCHRVVAAGGGLGGYSAHDGVATKRYLLKREGVSLLDS